MFKHMIRVPFTMSATFATYPLEEMKMHTQDISTYANKHILDERMSEYGNLKDNIWFESDLSKDKDLVYKTSEALELNHKFSSMLGLGLEIEDDILIMHKGKLESGFVAFASSWNVGDKQGKTLQELHSPIADGDKLRNASDRIMKAITGKNCYHRYTWGISSLDKLSNHPSYEKPDFDSIDDLCFRVEHERTMPVKENETCALLISVKMLSLRNVLATDGELLKKSIDSMTDSVLEYKNLKKVKKLVNEYV